MANLKDVIYLSNIDYNTLVTTGSVTIGGTTLTYNENNLYITPDELASSTQDGLMSASDKVKLDGIDLSKYLPLTGGTISANTVPILTLKRTVASSASLLDFKNNNQDTNLWRIGMDSDGTFQFRYSSNSGSSSTILAYISNSGSLQLNNNTGIYGKDSSGNSRTILKSTSGNNLNLGNSGWSDIYVYNKVVPDTTDSKNLGSSTLQWNNIYGKTIYENGTSLSSKYLALTGGSLSGNITINNHDFVSTHPSNDKYGGGFRVEDASDEDKYTWLLNGSIGKGVASGEYEINIPSADGTMVLGVNSYRPDATGMVYIPAAENMRRGLVYSPFKYNTYQMWDTGQVTSGANYAGSILMNFLDDFSRELARIYNIDLKEYKHAWSVNSLSTTTSVRGFFGHPMLQAGSSRYIDNFVFNLLLQEGILTGNMTFTNVVDRTDGQDCYASMEIEFDYGVDGSWGSWTVELKEDPLTVSHTITYDGSTLTYDGSSTTADDFHTWIWFDFELNIFDGLF